MATISGTEGNDSISGTVDNDTINGLGGNDFLAGNSGDDSVVGGTGNDTIFGDGGNDWLEGGAGNDSLSGGGGQDSYVFREFGAANADAVTSFDTNWDRIQLDVAAFAAIGANGRFSAGDVRFYSAASATGGHDADDRIVYNSSTGQLFYDADGNGAGAAQLIATFQGSPTLVAADINVFGTPTPTPTAINGTEGNDSIVGTPNDDTINGLGGDDTLIGSAGNDRLDGGAGNDSLRGDEGADTLIGGDGNDTLDGWRFRTDSTGPETLDGGAGNDRFLVDNPADVVTDSGGVDTVVAKNINWTLAPGFENLVINNGEIESRVDGIGNELDNVLDGRSGGVMGTGGDGWHVFLDGRGGNDTIYGSVQEDTLLGGDGNDFIDSGEDFDSIEGGAGDDTLSGGFGDFDTMTGGAGADHFRTDGGFDVITDFTAGTDKLELDGTFLARTGPSGNFAPNDERFYAAAGATEAHDATDRVIYNTTTGDVYYDPDGTGSEGGSRFANVAGLTATDINVVNGNVAGATINGTAGNDSLMGTPSDDTINGLGGNDTIDGAGGDDVLNGGDGNDSIIAVTGFDTVSGGAGNDTIQGGAASIDGGTGDDTYFLPGFFGGTLTDAGGIDTIITTGMNPLLPGIENLLLRDDSPTSFLFGVGNELDNLIRNESPAESFIDGADGNDRLVGSSNKDHFSFSHGSGNIGNDTVDGGAGEDDIQIGDFSAVVLDFRSGTVVGGGNGGSGSVSFSNIEIASGGRFNDRLIADDGGRRLYGGSGGDDTLIGGAGNDTFSMTYFESGHDVLDGGGGNNTLEVYGNFGATADLTAGTLSLPPSNSATFTNIQNYLGSPYGADSIRGNSQANWLVGDFGIGNHGADTIDGLGGNDTLSGGGNNDQFLFTVAPGEANADLITDFTRDADKIVLDGTVHANSGPSGNFVANDARFYAAAGATGGHDADDRVIYDTTSGNLYWDADGSGAGVAQRIATVQTTFSTISATDIAIINGSPTPTPTPTPGQNIQGTTGNDSLVGGTGNDTIYGNAGNDTIEGKGGNDSVSGGGGQDVYVFHEYGAANADTVANFDTNWDALRLDAAAFNTLGSSGRFSGGDVRFYAGAGATAAHDADDRIVYNTSSGQLFYDADGAGGQGAQLIATFQGAPSIAAGDITVFGTPTPTPTPGAINGTEGNDSLVGTAGKDTINGFGGNDTIDGRGGADSMVGGSGDDVYFVDNSFDTIVEAENGGIDEVRSTVDIFILPTWVDNLTLLPGSGATLGSGNEVDNVITGNALDNTLEGQDGADTLIGGDGNDRLFGGSGDDVLRGDAGNDSIDPGWDNDTVDGGAGIDLLTLAVGTSERSNVTVNLATGVMTGGSADGTNHTVLRSIEGVDAGDMETRSINLTGSSGADFLRGGRAADTIMGGAGNDTIYGSAFAANANGDLLMGGDGNDSVASFGGNSILNGGAGNDVLSGSDSGADSFVFDVAPGAANADQITSFASGSDKIHLDARVMGALGASGNFAAGDVRFYAAPGASSGHDADDRVVYNTSTGQLWYDADGSSAAAPQLIATLANGGTVLALAASDIVVDNGTPTPTPTPTPGQTFNGTAGNDTVVGTSGNDTIFGNSGNDWLEGRGGNDQISGGGGQDSYVFREFGAPNADSVANFDTNWDSLRFDGGAFTNLGAAGHFATGDARFYAAAGAAGGHDADDRLIYNTSTGQLYYDADGSGAGGAELVATLQGAPAVAAGDVWVI